MYRNGIECIDNCIIFVEISDKTIIAMLNKHDFLYTFYYI